MKECTFISSFVDYRPWLALVLLSSNFDTNLLNMPCLPAFSLAISTSRSFSLVFRSFSLVSK
jgi:hypothetical protein